MLPEEEEVMKEEGSLEDDELVEMVRPPARAQHDVRACGALADVDAPQNRCPSSN